MLMYSKSVFATLIILFATSVLAQSPINSFPPGMFANRSDPVPYVGPGDIQSGALAFYSLRAYSRSYAAAGTHPAINVRRFSDNHTCDILLVPSGGLGLTSNCSNGGDNGLTPLSFSGIDVTCTGTTSGTTLSCTGASGQPSASCCDFVSGAGITGLYILSCSVFSGGSGTCTMNAPAATNITTPELITLVNPVGIPTWYDQSGNGSNISQATTGLQWSFNPIGLNGTLPIVITGTGRFSNASIASIPTYYIATAGRQVNFTTEMGIIASEDDGNNPNGPTMYWQPSANLVGIYGGSTVSGTSTDLTLHGLQGLVNGASSVMNVDGTETTGNAGPNGLNSGSLCVGAQGGVCTASLANGVYAEAGAWAATTPSSGVRSSMCNNIRIYWGTPGSC